MAVNRPNCWSKSWDAGGIGTEVATDRRALNDEARATMSKPNPASNVKRSFQNAIEILNQRRRPARPTSKSTVPYSNLERMPNINGRSDMRGTPSIIGMTRWLQRLGHSASEINTLNVIHVAGTKGKGSTCAFVDNFLGCHSERSRFPRKRGLYTSPHLLAPEERIRINMKPLGKDLFAQYFFEVFDNLAKHEYTAVEPQPRYLQLFFLLALHTFLREGVDVAIIETHHGGEYDATNIFERPVVTAITSLGLDHVSQLGPSIGNIAWHKAGIFKAGAAAFSVVEDPSVAKVLEDRAAAKGADLTFVDLDPALPRDSIKLQPEIQRLNCSLALAISRYFISQKDPVNCSLHHSDVLEGIRRFSWPGRFQTIVENNSRWYLDGAHNAMSTKIASKWFIETSTAQKQSFRLRILIFGQVSSQRDPTTVIQSLAQSFFPGDVEIAIFTLYDPVEDFEAPSSTPRSNDTQSLRQFADIWSTYHPDTKVLFAENVPRALNLARAQTKSDDRLQALITGSQHLVGAALFSLGHRSQNYSHDHRAL